MDTMDTRPARRITVWIEADAFRRLAELAARERRAVRDQAAVVLEEHFLGCRGRATAAELGEPAQETRVPAGAGAAT